MSRVVKVSVWNCVTGMHSIFITGMKEHRTCSVELFCSVLFCRTQNRTELEKISVLSSLLYNVRFIHEKTCWNGFKVYAVLTVQLFFTAGVIALFNNNDAILEALGPGSSTGLAVMWTCNILFMVTYFCLVCPCCNFQDRS